MCIRDRLSTEPPKSGSTGLQQRSTGLLQRSTHISFGLSTGPPTAQYRTNQTSVPDLPPQYRTPPPQLPVLPAKGTRRHS
eukprot:2114540-Rhodomonas_salina.1